ncbi:hypothetical protein VKT23_013030 [Stygiomarasmius scandens]|uniref:Uncharacterized protein n=1 Tax=Marasmiellus scandens TaxID=2682957 RepID=A0ABR1J9Q7_9AGAR
MDVDVPIQDTEHNLGFGTLDSMHPEQDQGMEIDIQLSTPPQVHTQPEPGYFDTPNPNEKLPPRNRAPPKPFKDMIPSISLLHHTRKKPTLFSTPSTLSPSPPVEAHLGEPERSTPAKLPSYETDPDEFGLYRIYDQKPSHDPAENIDLHTLTDFPIPDNTKDMSERSPFSGLGPNASSSIVDFSSINPFPNIGIFRLMQWHYTVKQKSLGSLKSLVENVILPADFQQEHFQSFNPIQEGKRMDNYMEAKHLAAKEQPLPWNAADGWIKSSATLKLPRAKKSSKTEDAAPEMKVDNVWYRDVVEVIKAAFQSELAWEFHMKPFKLMWKPSTDEPLQRVHGEAFWTDRMIDMDRRLPKIPGCDLEQVAVPMQLWSDSTHLTSFGTQKMWPIYLYLGNLSKYTRSCPSAFSAYHIAYIPSLPDKVKDVYEELFDGQHPSNNEITHLRRELVHAVLAFLFNPRFRDAYLNGVVVKCVDAILRRIFPRLFSYSADYVEKYGFSSVQ